MIGLMFKDKIWLFKNSKSLVNFIRKKWKTAIKNNETQVNYKGGTHYKEQRKLDMYKKTNLKKFNKIGNFHWKYNLHKITSRNIEKSKQNYFNRSNG